MARIKDTTFRVAGYDEAGDIPAYETEDRAKAEAMLEHMREDLENVTMDRQRFTV